MADPARCLPPEAGLGEVRVVRALGGGGTAETWLVDTGEGRAVLRIDRPLAKRLALDRVAEREILRDVSAAGLAPRVLYAAPDRGVLVTRYLRGRTWEPADLEDPRRLVALGSRLRELHALPARGKPFDLATICAGYARQVGTRLARELARQAGAAAASLGRETGRVSICHNDLVAANIVESGSVQFIDWEYAAVGDPLFDLAVVVRHHSLPPGRVEGLLEAWLGGAPTDRARDRLRAFCELYGLVAALWQAVVDTEPAG